MNAVPGNGRTCFTETRVADDAWFGRVADDA